VICHLQRQPETNENSIIGRGNKCIDQDNVKKKQITLEVRLVFPKVLVISYKAQNLHPTFDQENNDRKT